MCVRVLNRVRHDAVTIQAWRMAPSRKSSNRRITESVHILNIDMENELVLLETTLPSGMPALGHQLTELAMP